MSLETPIQSKRHTGLVRIGFAADLFWASAASKLSRGTRVLVRTPRGVELGDLVTPTDIGPDERLEESTVEIVRAVTFQDEAILERLTRHKVDAVRRCQAVLQRVGATAQLLDVDQLIDGGTLILHFLGDVTAEQQAWIDEVVEEYERSVESIRLAELIERGCGPTCGEGDGTSQGCGGGCASCAGCGVRSEHAG